VQVTPLQLLLVGCGGFLGSVLRFALAAALSGPSAALGFPLGTLAVNLIGCAAIGVVLGLADARQLLSADARAFAAVGVLGGFTTFSAFGYETFALLREGAAGRAAANVALQVLLGLLCVWAGYAASGARP
jgi:fluoride exporter